MTWDWIMAVRKLFVREPNEVIDPILSHSDDDLKRLQDVSKVLDRLETRLTQMTRKELRTQ